MWAVQDPRRLRWRICARPLSAPGGTCGSEAPGLLPPSRPRLLRLDCGSKCPSPRDSRSPGVGVQGGSFQPQQAAHCPPVSQGLEELHLGTWTPGSSTPSPVLLQVCPMPLSVPTEPSLSASPGVPAPCSHFSCPHTPPRAAPCIILWQPRLPQSLLLVSGTCSRFRGGGPPAPVLPKAGPAQRDGSRLQGVTIAEETEAGLGPGWAGPGGAGGGCPHWGHSELA